MHHYHLNITVKPMQFSNTDTIASYRTMWKNRIIDDYYGFEKLDISKFLLNMLRHISN